MASNAVERSDVKTLARESNNNLESDSEDSLENFSKQRTKRKLSNSIDENHIKKHKLCSSSSDEDAVASNIDSNILPQEEMQIDKDENSHNDGEEAASLMNKENEFEQEEENLEKKSVGSDSTDSDDETLGLKKEKMKSKTASLQSDEDESSADNAEDNSSEKNCSEKENRGLKKLETSVGSDSYDSDDEILGLKKKKVKRNNLKTKPLQSDEDESSCDSLGDGSSVKKKRRGSKKESKPIKKTEKIPVGFDSTDSDDETLDLKKDKNKKSDFEAESLQSDEDSCNSVKKSSSGQNKNKGLKRDTKHIEKEEQISMESDCDDSDDEPLGLKKEKSEKSNFKAESLQSDEHESSCDDIEDSSSVKKKRKSNKKENKPIEKTEKMSVGSGSNDSDDETLYLKKKKSKKGNFKAKLLQSDEDESSCDDVEDSSSVKKKHKGSKEKDKSIEKSEQIPVGSESNDSNDETLELTKKKTKKSNFEAKLLQSDGDENSCDNEEDISSKKKKKSSKKENKHTEKTEKVKKTSPASNNRIEHLKKYVRAAGIRVQSYSKIFEKCKSQKSKVEKMLELLHEQGLKGKPTLEKCKKLRKKIETRKEFAELDQSNIIQSEGRRRGIRVDIIDKKPMKTPSPKKKFSRLKDIFDSEESD